MTEPPRTRRVAIRKWSCPNHPDGPPTLPAEGWDPEEITFEAAYGVEEARVLHELLDAFTESAAGQAAAAQWIERLGLCCLGHEWSTVGYEDVEVGALESYLYALRGIVPQFTRTPVLLSELVANADGKARIPIVVHHSDPGDEQPDA